MDEIAVYLELVLLANDRGPDRSGIGSGAAGKLAEIFRRESVGRA